MFTRTTKLTPALLRRYASSTTPYINTAGKFDPSIPLKPLTSILIANRGEIALRVAKTAAKNGVRTTTVYTDPDAKAQHANVSPFAVNLGDVKAYLDGERILKAAKERGCGGIHPGYGFLSENSKFARRCEEEGIVFIGPPASAIEAMGNKSESKDIMLKAGVPCIPGYHGPNQDPAFLLAESEKMGFPVLIKAVKGGGGKGMRIAMTAAEFPEMLESAKSEARSSFGDDVVLVEKYITTPRHIEVQVFADAHGNCVALGERDCSVQRRHQKILEESPAPNLEESIRKDIWHKAREAALAVGYRGAGTVEFIFDNDTGEFFFMEMNTRLQVEHPVTEMVTGTDLVHWQLLVASGFPLPLTQEQIEAQMSGHAFEARIYAENPDAGFMPDSGTLVHLRTPTPSEDIRIDAGFGEGDLISTNYDPMIAKLIVRGNDRQEALLKLKAALEEYEIAGMSTNIEFIKRLCSSPAFIAGDVETGYIEKHRAELFTPEPTPPEVYAQAALSHILSQTLSSSEPFSSLGGNLGFTPTMQSRTVNLVEKLHEADPVTIPVRIDQIARNTYTIHVGDSVFPHITIAPTSSAKNLTTFFPHTRLDSTIIRTSPTDLTIFQLGKLHKLSLAPPSWFAKALGAKDLSHSVLAPMPCKVIRVLVAEGETVKKDQPLVVIESMKMETVIRSPKEAKVGRVVHSVGDVVKQGTELVEFESEEKSE